MTKTISRSCCVLLLLISAALGWAQAGQPANEHGVYELHKFEQAMGKETYTITRSGNEVALKSDFKFTDRGTEVPLTTSLTMDKDLTPKDFQIKGKISRFSAIDNSVHGRSAGQVSIPAGENFFDIEGYAPVSVQLMLMRYWKSHGSPKSLKTLP